MGDRVDEILKDLRRARKRLCPEQGRRARRNARRGFLGAMKALRNALDQTYPYVEKTKEPEERYVVEVFEPVRRIGRRLYTDRWRVLRPKDFHIGRTHVSAYEVAVPKRFPRQPTYRISMALKFAAWCREAYPKQTFRLRKVGTSNTIAADVL